MYRPHLVLGDASRGTVAAEKYLGVRFTGEGRQLPAGPEHHVVLELMYDGIDYSQLVPGATFTIREGSTVVGSGRVVDTPPEPTIL